MKFQISYFVNIVKILYICKNQIIMKKNAIYVSNGGEINPATITDTKFVVLLDNGHAKSTKGKCSPLFEDGSRFYEYEFARDVVRRISEKLQKENILFKIVTPEVEEDIPLTTRANRVNRYCQKYGKNNCILISVHANASGDGSKWMPARGWSVWTTKGKTKSDEYADIFYKEAKKLLPLYGMTMRQDLADGDYDFESNFTIIYKSNCPAILTENLFQDNKKDCEFLMSDKGRDVIADVHVNAIKQIINEKLRITV